MPCSKGMRNCHPKCLHRKLVLEYHDARDARDSLRESEIGYQLEDYEFDVKFPPILFKQWLIGHAASKDLDY